MKKEDQRIRVELNSNEDVVYSRQHQRVESRALGNAKNQLRFHISSGFVFFWLTAALLSLCAWVLKLWGWI